MNNLFAQIINLTSLKALRDYMAELDSDYSKLEMKQFASQSANTNHNGILFPPESVTTKFAAECNTSMCLLGHMPLIKDYAAYQGELWDDYSDRVFRVTDDTSSCEYKVLWDFLFFGTWPNSLPLALHRMDCVLEAKPFDIKSCESLDRACRIAFPLHVAYNILLNKQLFVRNAAAESKSIG